MMKSFFKSVKEYTLNSLLQHINCSVDNVVLGNATTIDDVILHSTSDLSIATSGEISFISSPKFKLDAMNTQASVVLACEKTKEYFTKSIIIVVVPNPQECYAKVKMLFYPKAFSAGTISDNSTIDVSASIGNNVEVRSGACIRVGVVVGDNVVICENVVIGDNVEIGNNTVIGAGSVIEYSVIGGDGQIHSNVTIGSRGFGFIPNAEAHIDIMQTGGVSIGNNVEIGAGTCIDRGAEKDTVICDNVRIDNLVHIAHNAYIGKNSILAGQVGFAGSVTIGENVMFGGQAGVSPGVNVGASSVIMGRSGVARDVPENSVYAGFPARPYREWLKDNLKKNNEE